jgi:hypothetical protein
MLRDIYPITILSAAHMGRLVGEVPLRTWIERSNTHGILRAISASNWMWIIDEENIPSMRAIFANAGILIVDIDCPVASA